jgi:hypothetical protein
MRSHTLFALVNAVAIAVTASSPRAQRVGCVQPASCTLKVTSDTTRQYLSVIIIDRNQNPVPDAPVTFQVISEAGSVTTGAKSDVNGIATTMWVPAPGATLPSEIRVSAAVGTDRPTRLLRIVSASSTASTLAFADHPGNHQTWYEERQQQHPLRVEISGPASETECLGAAVAFRPGSGGTSAPDTAYGMWSTEDPQHCVATSWWRLSKGVGRQSLRANLVGEPAKAVNFSAQARALPRIVVGLAAYQTHSFSELQTTVDTIVVTRQFAGQTSTLTRRSRYQTGFRLTRSN